MSSAGHLALAHTAIVVYFWQIASKYVAVTLVDCRCRKGLHADIHLHQLPAKSLNHVHFNIPSAGQSFSLFAVSGRYGRHGFIIAFPINMAIS